MMKRFASAAVAALTVFLCSHASADEGMWPFHGAPLAYAAGKQSMGRKAGDHAKVKAFKRRMARKSTR